MPEGAVRETRGDRAYLESIIMAGTPDDVRRRYLSIESRARGRAFGELEDDLVVLDTETTGLSFRDCELIEVSAARLRGGEVIDRFDSYVHPSGPIPQEIVDLTGITDLDVADAPRARDVVAALASFVGRSPVIAHNATFDRHFVEKVRGGHLVSDTWVDSLALSRIALPCLSTHRLADLARAFGCAEVTHDATDDVNALAGLWRMLLVALGDLPAGLLGHLASVHPEVEWSYRPLFERMVTRGAEGDDVVAPVPASEGQKEEKDKGGFDLKAARLKILGAVDATPARFDAADKGDLAPVSEDEVEDAFGTGGVVPRMFDGYEARDEQVQMAKQVAAALDTSTHRCIEAGTGVGKSLAYLLPMALFAKRNGITVGVATKTNSLSDQLFATELPRLAKALPGGLSYVELKGFDHYPCLLRLEQSMTRELPANLTQNEKSDVLSAIATALSYVCQMPDGDLDGLGIRWNHVPRYLLACKHTECLRRRCPYFLHACPLMGARQRAGQSDVVVTNHSLLLSNVSADGRVLPPIRHWVVDEAHGLEEEARRLWALEVSSDRVRAGFRTLGTTKGGTIASLLGDVDKLDASSIVTRLLTSCSAKAERAADATSELIGSIGELGDLVERGGRRPYDVATVWIDDKVRDSAAWARVTLAGNEAIRSLDEARRSVRAAAEAMQDESPQSARELLDAGSFLDDVCENVRTIVSGEDDTFVYAADVALKPSSRAKERLFAEKIEVGHELAKRWLSEMSSVVFTSATIAVGERFDHFEHAVGLDEVPAGRKDALLLSSSFDFERNMAVVVAKDLPEPNDARYLDRLVDLLFDVHVAMGGSVLTLFTSRRDMERVYQGLSPRLKQEGLDLLVQSRGSSVRHLRQRFVSDERSSMLALKSFWEGFDASGDTLRCVVVARLPFAVPNDPLSLERKRRERNSWMRYTLPDAVLAVKQAAGRLIRTADDRGVLVMADSRVATKRYGRAFIESMPTDNCTLLGCDNVGRYLELWRA